jgi:hypothetical protein
MEDLSDKKEEKNLREYGPFWLPIVIRRDFAYFADLKLRQFRRVDNYLDCIEFDSPKGQTLLKKFGFVECPYCTQRAAVRLSRKPKKICCVRCLETYEL